MENIKLEEKDVKSILKLLTILIDSTLSRSIQKEAELVFKTFLRATDDAACKEKTTYTGQHS